LNSGWEIAAKSWLEADGSKPRKLGYITLEWLPAQVPGHVHADLIRHGVIADPYTRMAELGAQWVDEEDWSYRRTFQFSPDAELPARVLRFEGLDTVCRVLLNGEVIAEHDNMFLPLELDVSARLKAGQNELRIDFQSAARVGRERQALYFAREGLPADVARFPERSFVRKAQYMFAWDWGPRLVSAGIWRSVSLLEHSARLLDVRALQVHHSDGGVELRFESEIEGAGEVMHQVEGIEGLIRDGQSVRVPAPELWWPAGMGEQKLYRVESFLVRRASKDVADARRRCLDRREQRIGLRTLRLLRERDRHGESFAFEVNGRPLYAVGANWIPDDCFPGLVDRARLRGQLERARDMNMNMLRVWGGGLYESDDFYELADELGLLVWQDFPFACAYVPDDEAAQAAVRPEAEANVRRLRNHPSLCLWCGNNENLTMWHSKWDRPRPQPSRYYGEHIYDVTLPDVVARLDPERAYIASSPIGGENANDGGVGDQHYWDVWHGRGDWKHYQDSTGRFASEFGFAAAPGRSVWRRIYGDLAELGRDVRDRTARWHDKTGKGYDTYVGYVALHYPESSNLEHFVYTSQLNQRDALRFGIEHFRRAAFCRGALIWQLNDCWPVQSWAVLDSDGVYKAAAYELRRLYAPALISIEGVEAQRGSVRVWTILDNTVSSVSGELTLEARRLADGRVLESWSREVSLSPGERRIALEVETAKLSAEETVLVARFNGSETTRLLSEPKAARLPEPRLIATRHPDGLLIETNVPVIDLFVWDDIGEATFVDNYVTLVSPGAHLLRVRGDVVAPQARSLRGRHPIVF
jgi:beta-mannosidase